MLDYEISPTEAKELLSENQARFIDVREPWEIETAKIAGSVSIPMRDIPARSEELDDEAQIVCVCHHGARSANVAMFLESRGFTKVFNLQGGIDAWSRQVDSTVPTY